VRRPVDLPEAPLPRILAVPLSLFPPVVMGGDMSVWVDLFCSGLGRDELILIADGSDQKSRSPPINFVFCELSVPEKLWVELQTHGLEIQ
jgi:hypothetical protein